MEQCTNMFCYELLPKLTFMTLTGQDDDGELEFIGTEEDWDRAEEMEAEMCA